MTINNQTLITSLAKKRRIYSAEFKQQIVQACNAYQHYHIDTEESCRIHEHELSFDVLQVI